MIRTMDLERTLILAVLSAIVGVCYKFAECWLALPLIIIVWSLSLSRVQAFCNMFIYYIIATYDLMGSMSVFFSDISHPLLLGSVCWIGVSVLLAGIWCLAWASQGRYWRFLVAMAVITVPPVGLVSFANPLSSVGFYFAGMGVVGVAVWLAIVFLWLVSIERNADYYTVAGVLLIGFIVIFYPKHQPTSFKIHTINTHLGQVKDDKDNFYYFEQLTKIISADVKKYQLKNTLIVLPETIGGVWSNGSELIWSRLSKKLAERNITVLFGAELLENTQYYNSLISVGKEQILLKQRIPVPISMYKPFSNDGAIADVWGKGVGKYQQYKFSYFICYESLIVWPYLTSLFNKNDFVILTSNLWFAKKTGVIDLQKTTIQSFSKLYGVNAYSAINN